MMARFPFFSKNTEPTEKEKLTQADRVLAERLCFTFERDLSLLPVSGVHFYVKDGIVSLHGTVEHSLNQELLISFIQDIEGVSDVVSHLEVRGEETGTPTPFVELMAGLPVAD